MRVGGKIAKLQLHKAKAADGSHTIGYVTKSNQRLDPTDWSEISIATMSKLAQDMSDAYNAAVEAYDADYTRKLIE